MNEVMHQKKIYQLFKRIKYCCFFYLLMIFPVSEFLPEWVGWENGVLENSQVVVLLVDCIMNFFFYKHTIKSNEHGMWLTISGFSLLLMGRELNWGRVFFQTTMTEHGPVFLSMNQMPYHSFINAAIGIYIIVLLICFIITIPWKKIFQQLPFPKSFFIMSCVAVILSTIEDRSLIFHSFQDENIEELAELLVYFLLGCMSSYYYFWIKYFEHKI